MDVCLERCNVKNETQDLNRTPSNEVADSRWESQYDEFFVDKFFLGTTMTLLVFFSFSPLQYFVCLFFSVLLCEVEFGPELATSAGYRELRVRAPSLLFLRRKSPETPRFCWTVCLSDSGTDPLHTGSSLDGVITIPRAAILMKANALPLVESHHPSIFQESCEMLVVL